MKATFSRNNGKNKHKMTHKSAETITQQLIHIKILVSEFHLSYIEKFTGESKAKKI
jgi:hypothetical protein